MRWRAAERTEGRADAIFRQPKTHQSIRQAPNSVRHQPNPDHYGDCRTP